MGNESAESANHYHAPDPVVKQLIRNAVIEHFNASWHPGAAAVKCIANESASDEVQQHVLGWHNQSRGDETAVSEAIRHHLDDTYHADADAIRHAAIEANRPALSARIDAEVAAHAREKPHISGIEMLRQIDARIGQHGASPDHDRQELRRLIAESVKSHFDLHAHLSVSEVVQMIDHRVKAAVEAALRDAPGGDDDLRVGGSNGWSPAGDNYYRIVDSVWGGLMLHVWRTDEGGLPWHWAAYALGRGRLYPDITASAPTAGLAMKSALKAVSERLVS